MNKFEALFGIKASEVKKNCILLPLVQKDVLKQFKLKDFKKGKLFSSGNSDFWTLINTGIGPAWTGDAVLYLKETPCSNIFLFGSCGLVSEKNGLSIGSLVSPVKCFSNESFSDMLLKGVREERIYYPARELYERFMGVNRNAGIKEITCSTLASLKLEEDMLDYFSAKGIDLVDMECSAFFSAASFSGLNALAFFYITDIIKKKPFYTSLEPELKTKLVSSVKESANILCEFIKTNLSV
ncbi:MAG: hypothetical protein ABIH18_02940 [Candidatus Omnitrophota bacterium]